MSTVKLRRRQRQQRVQCQQQQQHYRRLDYQPPQPHQLVHSINSILMPSYDIKSFREFNRLLLMVAIAFCTMTVVVSSGPQHTLESRMTNDSTVNGNVLPSPLPLMANKQVMAKADVLVLIHYQQPHRNNWANNDGTNDSYSNDNVTSVSMIWDNFREFIELFGIELNALDVDFKFVDGK